MTQPPIELWGISAPLEPLEGGHRNQVWCALGLQQDLVFKSTVRSEAALDWLAPVQDAARGCGFVVPQMQRALSGAFCEEGWTCEAWVGGVALSRAQFGSVIPQLTTFHIRTAGWRQRPGFCSAQDLGDRDQGGDVDLTAMPADLVALCRAAWAAVAAPATSVVHGDLAPGNVLRCPDGRLALLDWDECRVDLPLFDTAPCRPRSEVERRAHLAWEVACGWLREPAYARDLATRLRNT